MGQVIEAAVMWDNRAIMKALTNVSLAFGYENGLLDEILDQYAAQGFNRQALREAGVCIIKEEFPKSLLARRLLAVYQARVERTPVEVALP